MVSQGTLSLTHARSLGEKTEIDISEGAMLELKFRGEMCVSNLSFDGEPQPSGIYNGKRAPRFIKGTGVLKNLETPKQTNP
jgi:hypothetical protein